MSVSQYISSLWIQIAQPKVRVLCWCEEFCHVACCRWIRWSRYLACWQVIANNQLPIESSVRDSWLADACRNHCDHGPFDRLHPSQQKFLNFLGAPAFDFGPFMSFCSRARNPLVVLFPLVLFSSWWQNPMVDSFEIETFSWFLLIKFYKLFKFKNPVWQARRDS